MPSSAASSNSTDATRHRWPRVIAANLGAAVAYFAAARLGLLLASLHGNVSPVWPATGVAICVLLIGGVRMWPSVLLGAFAANALTPVPTLVALGIAAGNTLEAIAGAWIVRNCAERWSRIGLLAEPASIALASFVAPVISATIGVASLAWGDAIASSSVRALWWTWWVGDALGALVVTPLVIALRDAWRVRERWTLRDSWRLLTLVVVAGSVCALVFFWGEGGVFLFVIFPVVLLATSWFGAVGGLLVAVLIAMAGISAAHAGQGPFIGANLNESLLNLQLLLATVAVAALVLPAFRTKGNVLLPVAVLLGGWTLSGLMYVLMHRDGVRRQEEFFGERVAEAQAAIRVRMNTYMDALRGGTSFIAASSSVNRDEWRIYAESLQLKDRYPGINGLGVIYAVQPDQIDAWRARVRVPGEPEPRITPFPNTEDRPNETKYLVTYLEGNLTDRAPTGRNIATDPSRRAAADLARDTGEPQINHRIPGSRDTQRRSGLLLYVPLYRKGASLETVAERRAAHFGWVYAQVYPDIFLDGVLGPMGKTLRLDFFESGGLDPVRLLYSSDGPGDGLLPNFERVTEMEMAGQRFQLAWRRGPKFPALNKSSAIWTSTSCAIATLLLAGLVMSLQSVGQRARAIAAERTMQLAASEARFRSAFDYAGIGVALVGLDGQWLRVNRSLCEIVGYSEDELLAKTFQDITHPDDLASDLLQMRALIEGRVRFYQMEKRYVHREGRLIWVRVTASLVRDVSGAPLHGIAQIEDVTARQDAANALHQSQQMFRRLFESAPDAIIMVDRQGKIVRGNDRLTALFGYTRDELAGLSLEQLLPERFRAQHGGYLAGYFAQPHVRQMGAGVELFGQRKDGSEFPLDVMLSPLETATGRQVLAVIRDLTPRRSAEAALRNSEERFRRAFEDAGIGMALVGLDGRWLRVNRALCEIIGYPEAELLRKSFQDITHPDDLQTDLKHLRELLDGARRSYQMEKRYFHSNGHIVWIRLTASMVRDSAGAPVHFVSQIEDITARKQLEVDLRSARDSALEASRLKSEFLANMSHEIRTPMNAVVGMTDVIADTPLTTEQREMVRAIQSGAENLVVIINDILDFSRIEAGKLRLDPVDFDFGIVVEETVALLAPRAHEKYLELACEVVLGAPSLLLGDAGRVRQVLTNLIGNAIKFTERGEILVTASVVHESIERRKVRVAVCDTGVGVPPEAELRLFQPFTQADGSATRRYGGSGLGLAISRQLVELMDGSIGFETEPGRGSTFWFEVEFSRRNAPATTAKPLLPGGRHVLVVDDNETNRRILLAQLARLGIEAEGVDGSAPALARLREAGAHWHAALLDWNMPGMSGLELALELRADPATAQVPLVMLSSAGQHVEAIAATAAGFSASLVKPVTEKQLARCLAHVLTEAPTNGGFRAKSGTEPRSAGSLDLLLVEDNPANQLVAHMLLDKMGHTVDIAQDGAVALARLGAKDYDAVFMDCQMPVLDGYETTRQIRSGKLPGVNPRVPIIALTAYAMRNDRAKCLEAGMDDYLTKPIRPAELSAALQRCRSGGGDRKAGAALEPLPEPPAETFG
jgi:PAS domain S-box-containing protein